MNLKIEFPKRKKNFKKDGSAIKPSKYWHIIVGTGFILILISFLFGMYFFSRINKDVKISEEEANLQNPSIKTARINNTLEYFEERKNKSKDILNEPAQVSDPSI